MDRSEFIEIPFKLTLPVKPFLFRKSEDGGKYSSECSLKDLIRDGLVDQDKIFNVEFNALAPGSNSVLPVIQIKEVVELATATFEDEQFAQDWLNRPNPATDNKRPVDLLGTEIGLKRVKVLIHRIAHGITA